MLNHWYHHRGQLLVYLRLLNQSVPSVYGPTWIYLSNVLWALGLKEEPTRRLSLQEEEQVARALGRVVAHEVVHAVVPDLVHSHGGLMAEKLGRAFLVQARAFLGPAEQKALRAGAERYAAAGEPARAPLTLAVAGH